MLVLSRHKNESLVINGNIVVTILEIRGDKVRIGIEAPKEVKVLRSELTKKKKKIENHLTFQTRDEEVNYLQNLKDGERVIETTNSCQHLWEGTIYHNDKGYVCVKWDAQPGTKGQLSTSVTFGTRRLTDVSLTD